jgi:hypothetical protein
MLLLLLGLLGAAALLCCYGCWVSVCVARVCTASSACRQCQSANG